MTNVASRPSTLRNKENYVHQTFVSAIKKASKEQNISLHQISKLAGYNKATLYKLTSGESLGTLATWADFFDVVGVEIGFRIVQKD